MCPSDDESDDALDVLPFEACLDPFSDLSDSYECFCKTHALMTLVNILNDYILYIHLLDNQPLASGVM